MPNEMPFLRQPPCMCSGADARGYEPEDLGYSTDEHSYSAHPSAAAHTHAFASKHSHIGAGADSGRSHSAPRQRPSSAERELDDELEVEAYAASEYARLARAGGAWTDRARGSASADGDRPDSALSFRSDDGANRGRCTPRAALPMHCGAFAPSAPAASAKGKTTARTVVGCAAHASAAPGLLKGAHTRSRTTHWRA